jgi:DNA-binding response OmpR family regulator
MAFVVAAFCTAENRRMVRAMLANAGHTVALFRTGEAAVAEALTGRPDVLIIDSRLADMSPSQVGEALRAQPSSAAIPLVLCGPVSADGQRMSQRADGRVLRAVLVPSSIRSAIAAALAVQAVSPCPPEPTVAVAGLTGVLLVEDDDSIAEPLIEGLARYGIAVDRVATGAAALAAPPAAMVLLDLGLPDIDGIEVFRQLRHAGEVPVIMLTARGDEADRVLGLELGADDYLAKPFSIRELVARMRAVGRRTFPPAELPGRMAAALG